MKPGTGGLLSNADQAKLLDYFVEVVSDLPSAEAAAYLAHMVWQFVFSRPEQIEPLGDHDLWFLLGGRGSGKTRAGAEKMSEWAQSIPASRWGAVGPTFASCREVQFEGISGLNNVVPASALWGGSIETAYNASRPQLRLANGATIRGYSSEKPGSLRGPQFHGLWFDEPAEFRDSSKLPDEINTTFSNAVLGNRNKAPDWRNKIIVTGTPSPVKLLAGEWGDSEKPGLLNGYEGVVVTKMSTYDNKANLSSQYMKRIGRLEGTRVGLQEIDAELLDAVEGALWRHEWIVLGTPPELMKFVDVVVGVDPSGGRDEIGIVVAGKDMHGMIWILDDRTDSYTPSGWAQEVEQQVRLWDATKVVAERNYGGDMVEETLIRNTDLPASMIEMVWASRGKLVRAEPVAAIYEPRTNRFGDPKELPGMRVKHAKNMPNLVGQMTGWKPGMASPNNLDALVWAVTWLTRDETSGAIGGQALASGGVGGYSGGAALPGGRSY